MRHAALPERLIDVSTTGAVVTMAVNSTPAAAD
jgi:hypothetical protein